MSTNPNLTSVVLNHFLEAFCEDRAAPISTPNATHPTSLATCDHSDQDANLPLYQPLQPGSQQIRVVVILPGTWHEVLQCALKVIDLADESEQYEAISYCWGDEHDKDNIIINRRPVQVTTNLHRALKRVRMKDKERAVWADAICINQCDLSERQQQVEMMRDIYSCAIEVQVLAGESSVSKAALGDGHPLDIWDGSRICRWFNDDRDLAIIQTFVYLAQMEQSDKQSAKNQAHFLRPRMAELCALTILWLLGRDECIHLLARSGDSFSDPWTSTWAIGVDILTEFLSQPWWHRIWVVQELVLAKKVTVHFGQCAFPWELLDDAFRKLGKHNIRGCCQWLRSRALPTPTWQMLEQLVLQVGPLAALRATLASAEILGARLSYSGPTAFFDMLVMSRGRDASDQRDKVYALLGLLPQDWWQAFSAEPIIPNYTRDLAAVYTDVCWKLLLIMGDLRILSHNAPNKVTAGLPSWVPDWCCETLHRGSLVTSEFAWDNMEPLGAAKATVGLESARDRSLTRLRIGGFRIATVGQSAVLPNVRGSNKALEQQMEKFSASKIVSAIRECRAAAQLPVDTLLSSEGDNVSGEDTKFWSTLLGDRFQECFAFEFWASGEVDGLNDVILPFKPGESVVLVFPGDTKCNGRQDAAEKRPLVGPNFPDRIWKYVDARSFFRLDNGLLGITTVDCLPGDEVYWFLGGRHPFVLRERDAVEIKTEDLNGDGDSPRLKEFELIGPCDVPDVTNGDWVWKEDSYDVLLC